MVRETSLSRWDLQVSLPKSSILHDHPHSSFTSIEIIALLEFARDVGGRKWVS